ncbi:PAS domain S-box protein [Rhizobium sp. P32RR-XVIII]|uniref:PAS domain S-box protein n=1 Tax=Rhizobium sp. P32RR-XVIII TaxID=2726738 RepID=UPI00197F3ED2|nr:PAS domain S-box protein [Rhizobium sp. P32RR-XVIII]
MGLRLLISVLLFSVSITLILTLLQLYIDYRRDVSALESRLEQISNSYLGSLAESLWTLDQTQLRLQLTGILQLPDISAVEVRETTATGNPFTVQVGAKSSDSSIIAQEYPLRRSVEGQEKTIGTLHIEATLAGIYRMLLNRAWTIFLGQAATILLLSLFIIYIFHYLITRHLFAIANFVSTYCISDPPPHLRLRRRPPRHEDELERLVTAFNLLSDDLQTAYHGLCNANVQLARDVAVRSEIEAVLREREARIRRLVEANIIGIFIWDFEGRIIEANDAFLQIVGYQREDLVAGRLSWADLTPPDWHGRDVQWLQEHKLTGSRPPIEKEYFRKDGSRVPVMIGAATFEESDNQGVAFVIDLTERKQAEEALRESEEQWRAVFENNPTMYFMIDDTGTILSVNPFGAEQLGYTVDELIGRPVQDIFHEEDRDAVQRNAAACLEHLGRAMSWELRKVRKDGSMLCVRETARAMVVKKRTVLLIVCEDITERKRAEEAARRSEEELRQVIETVPAMVWTALPDGHVDFINQRWREFTGLSLDETLGWSWEAEAPFHPEDIEAYLANWHASLATGQPFEAEMRIRRAADGEYRLLFESAVPLRDEGGNILKWYGFLVDIEDRRRTEEALQKAQAELAHVARVTTMGALTSSIAHEVNQPLGAIVTNANAALRWLASQPSNIGEAREALGRIVRDGHRAGEVIGRVRSLLRKTETATTRVELNALIEDTVGLLQGELRRHRILLHTELAEDLPPVAGDRVQLQQVILNLMMNGIEAMSGVTDRPRELLITSRLEASAAVLVAVRDTGTGLDPQSAELFVPFYTTKAEGLGLGLSICRLIIEAHGGRLWASANEPHGAVFQFTLPSEREEFSS